MTEIERLAAAGPRSVAALIERLVDPSWAVRRAAVAALARLGDAAVGSMLEALASARASEARIAALMDALVASSGEPEGALEALGSRAGPEITCDVASILGRRRSVVSVPTLSKWVSHADDNVAVAATEALGRIGGSAGIDALIGAVESRKFFRVFPAIDVLARSGDPRAIAPLTALLGDPVCALEAARALGRTGDLGAAMPLAERLTSANEVLVRVAAVALGEIEDHQLRTLGAVDSVVPAVRSLGEPGSAARRIERCLAGADPQERVALCRALGWLGADSAAATLVDLLGGDEVIARSAAMALRRLGPVGQRQILHAVRHGGSAARALLLPLVPMSFEATDDVVACIDDPDALVRSRACDILGRIGNVSAVPALFTRLGDPDASVVQSATGALHALGSPETERRALESARSSDPRVRRAGVRMIGYFGWASGLDALRDALADGDERVRESAIQSLPFIDDARATETLLGLSRAPAPRVRAAAMRALGALAPTEPILDALRAGSKDDDAWARYYACQSLGRLHSPETLADVLVLVDDPAGQVRVAAIEALARFSEARSTAALVAAAGSPDQDVRRAALLGLGMTKAREGLPAIVAAVSAPDLSTRLIALSAVASFDVAQSEELLTSAARDADPAMRATALGLLGARAGLSASLRLVELLEDERTREGALSALTQHVPGRVPALLAALERADDATAPVLVAALARMNRPDACAALGVALTMDRVEARRAAAAALAVVESGLPSRALERAALSDADGEVRRLATFALARR